MRERTPLEQETLIYSTPEQAQGLRERVAEQVARERRPDVARDREVVAEAVAHEMERTGQPPDLLKRPWEHTQEEHEEAQRLVDLTFQKDLPTALRQAEKSPHYPRILDLYHDVLTGEMYDLLRQERVNQQPLVGWGLILVAVIVGVLAGALVTVLWL